MLSIRQPVLAILILVTPLMTFAQGSWQGIPFGSSAEKILKLRGKLDITPVEPARDASNTTKKFVPLEVKTFLVGSLPFTVDFVLEESTKSLSLVQLNKKAGGYSFSSMDLALTEKYGQPLYREKTAVYKAHTWNTKDAKITLRHLTFWGTTDDISISYEPPSTAGDPNL